MTARAGFVGLGAIGRPMARRLCGGGLATTVFAVGKAATTAAFDEAMYAPTSRLSVATPAQATNPATTTGVVPGPGIGETIQAIKRD